jgi:hypothetical protein
MIKHLRDEHSIHCGPSAENYDENQDDEGENEPKNAKKRKHESAEQAILQFIIEAALPFTVVESSSFT